MRALNKCPVTVTSCLLTTHDDSPTGKPQGASSTYIDVDVAINQANIKALQQFDVWSHLQQDRANPYTDMHVWDKDSFGDIHFSCDEMGSDALGVIVENQALVNALSKSVEAQPNVELIIAGIDRVLAGPNQTMLMLDNDDVLSCRLLVGADGANSFVRKQAGLPITFKDYEHVVGVVAFSVWRYQHNKIRVEIYRL